MPVSNTLTALSPDSPTQKKGYPLDLLMFERLIRANASYADKQSRIETAFNQYMIKYREAYGISHQTGEGSVALDSIQKVVEHTNLENAINAFKTSLKQNPENQKPAIKNLLAAFEALQSKYEWNSDGGILTAEEQELREAVLTLQVSESESEQYRDLYDKLMAYEKEESDKSKKASELAAAIKELDSQISLKRKLLNYFSIFLVSSIALAICFGVLPLSIFISTAMPWILVTTGVLIAAVYSYHSYNAKVTIGRGVAVFISLATAILAYISVTFAHLPIPVAVLFASGCFLANLILYRANVPDVLNVAVNYFKNFFINLKKSSWKEIIWKCFISLAALVTGLVLTLGMFHSWQAVFGGSFIAAPYIFYPLMLIAFVANSAFVYRGISRVATAFSLSVEVYRKGLIIDKESQKSDAEDIYKLAKVDSDPNKIVLKGFTAVLYYYLGIAPKDSTATIIAKIIFHTVIKIAVVALIVFISQKALVDMNMTAFTEVLPWIHDATLLIITNIALYTSYGTRMSFVLLDLLNNASAATGALFKEKNRVYIMELTWQFVTLAWLSQAASENAITWFKKLCHDYMAEVKSHTQNHQLIEVWRAVGKDDWKTLWKKQIENDWKEASPAVVLYCHVKAIGAWALRLLTIPSIILNTASNGFIAIYNGGNAKGLYSPVPKAMIGGAASAGIVTVSATTLTEKRTNALKRQVSNPALLGRTPRRALAPQSSASPESNPSAVVTGGLFSRSAHQPDSATRPLARISEESVAKTGGAGAMPFPRASTTPPKTS